MENNIVIVTGDFNDGDYIESHYILNDDELLEFQNGFEYFMYIAEVVKGRDPKLKYHGDIANLLYKESNGEIQEVLSNITENAKELALFFWDNYTPYYDDGIDCKPHTVVKIEIGILKSDFTVFEFNRNLE